MCSRMNWSKQVQQPTATDRDVRGGLQRFAVAAMLLCAVAGCRTGPRGQVFSYRNLPQNYVAAKRENAQVINLSGLASAAPNSAVIGPGDVLDVTITTGLSQNDVVPIPVRVHEDGMANVPIVGPVPVAGLEPEAAEAAIAAACIQRQYYRSPHVTVTMKKQRVNRVMVVGGVKEPGVYELPSGNSDLLAALVAAKGLANDAGTEVEIRNPTAAVSPGAPNLPPIAGDSPDGIDQVNHNWSSPTVAATPTGSSSLQSLKVDLVSATREGRGGYKISDGAVVMVEKRDPEPLHVIGLVHKPNRYEFPIGEDLRLLDALALAGGTASPVASKIYVIRKQPNGEQTFVVNVTITEAKENASANIRLSPGDIVSVEKTPATVMYDVLKFVRFGLTGSVPLLGL
ncbi:hypothetical protein GC163_13800 [bacterium]|nr:hypothetical protein [bacterium]